MTSAWPLHPSLRVEGARINGAFSAPDPLPNFTVVESFLDEGAVRAVLDEIDATPFQTYCVWSDTGHARDLRAGFREPDEEAHFLTVHQRPTSPIAALELFADALSKPACLELLSAVSGRQLRRLGRPAVLTGWGPGTFLGPHADAGPAHDPVLLVVSLSLTRSWVADHGGSTTYAWEGDGREVTLPPRLNRAVLFQAHRGSLHWVSPVAWSAPDRTRYTWTLHFY